MAQLKGFQELTPVKKALNEFFKVLQPKRLDTLLIPIEQAMGRVTAKSIIAERNLPPFDRSAMDGYALKAKDTFEASQFQPKTLHLVKKETVEKGEASEIWTGTFLPKGADTVVMLEHTRKADGKIEVLISLTPGANVSKKGEDLKKGDPAVEDGVELKPHHLGLLAASGTQGIEVVRKPRAAILPTGNELVALGDKLEPNQIIEVNSIILSGMCTELGAEAFSLGIATDNENEIKEKICEGLAKADIVITTGGTSVGIHDVVPKVIEQIERHSVVAHGIAMRPSMPTALAVVHGKPVIILSGNPVAAVVGFEVFARPLIQKLLGIRNDTRVKLKAKLTRRVAGVLGRRVFLRVKVVEKDGEFLAEPIRVKGSSIITTMTKANGYVVIPEDREGLRENEIVTVHLFDTIKEEVKNV
ncbi:molybdopterin molybdotransferase MoeA [Candidatus Bathyarchaeota archaeon]|nr:molybdopterin molybdotransferase MoeA [Candidatus Bathyarchaeota archaeon]